MSASGPGLGRRLWRRTSMKVKIGISSIPLIGPVLGLAAPVVPGFLVGELAPKVPDPVADRGTFLQDEFGFPGQVVDWTVASPATWVSDVSEEVSERMLGDRWNSNATALLAGYGLLLGVDRLLAARTRRRSPKIDIEPVSGEDDRLFLRTRVAFDPGDRPVRDVRLIVDVNLSVPDDDELDDEDAVRGVRRITVTWDEISPDVAEVRQDVTAQLTGLVGRAGGDDYELRCDAVSYEFTKFDDAHEDGQRFRVDGHSGRVTVLEFRQELTGRPIGGTGL